MTRRPSGRERSSLHTPPERKKFETSARRASVKSLIWSHSQTLTKMTVVRLLRRKQADRDKQRPELAPQAGRRGSDNLAAIAAFCGVLPADRERKKNVPTERIGRAEGTQTPDTARSSHAAVPSRKARGQ
jgi:hypothetical protein